MQTNRLNLTAEETIARLREALDVSTDQELAKSLNVSKQTVSAWRRRKSVPQNYISEVAGRTMTSIEYFIDGSTKTPIAIETHGVVNEDAYGLVIVFYERLRGLISIGDDVMTAMFWGALLPRIIQHYEYELQSVSEQMEINIEEAALEIAQGIRKMSDAEALRLFNKRLDPMARS